MAITNSSTLRNALANAFETAVGSNGRFAVYSGTVPANADASVSGNTVLAALVDVDGEFMSAASSGVASLTTQFGSAAIATGVATFFRWETASGAASIQQGLVSEAWTVSKTVVVGQMLSNATGVRVCSVAGTTASSGTGPTATSGSITDGTATFTFVQAAPDFTISSTNITTGQTVNLTAYTQTAS